MNELIISIAAGMIIIPWCIWVTVSLFNQFKGLAMLEQQLASHKQELSLNREILSLLKGSPHA